MDVLRILNKFKKFILKKITKLKEYNINSQAFKILHGKIITSKIKVFTVHML